MVKCVCIMGFRFNGCFMTDVALTDGQYKTYIIRSMGHLRSDLVELLVLWMVAYNGRTPVLY